MHFGSVRTLFFLFVPGGLLFAVAWGLLQMGWLEETLPAMADIFLYVVAVAGVLFGWRFNRSRLVFAVVVVALADRALVTFSADPALPEAVSRTVHHGIFLLLPLNLALFVLIKERGILTWRGIWRQILIVLQIIGLFFICKYERWDLASFFDFKFFDPPFGVVLPLPQPAALAFAVAILVILSQYLRRRGQIESGFFWALVSVFFAMEGNRFGPPSTFYFAVAGFILVISAIESSHTMAFRDELTGLPARRALDETLLKLGSTYTVAMIDIDHFKQFNDKYGHQIGDQVLRMVSAKLAKVQGGGKPFRYGGEEFTIVFPGKLHDETIPYLERLRKTIGEMPFMLRTRDRRRDGQRQTQNENSRKKEVFVTVSIGVADRNGRDASPQEIVKAADKALYRAKKAGRNRIET